jgi:hypothetical protein
VYTEETSILENLRAIDVQRPDAMKKIKNMNELGARSFYERGWHKLLLVAGSAGHIRLEELQVRRDYAAKL